MDQTLTQSRTRREAVGHRRRSLAIGFFALAFGFSASASAQEMRFEEAVELLGSDDADSIRLALETLATKGETRAIAPIAERIRGGLPPDLADAAVMALGALGKPQAGPVLFELLSHRRASMRQAAVEAIATTTPRGAGEALVRTLSDPEPDVRSAAAIALGQVGHREGVDALFAALDHDVFAAGAALGQLVTPAQMDRLFAYVGRLPFDVLTPALNEVFARDDFATPAKVELVGRLAELATPEVKAYLTELAEVMPAGRVKEAAVAAAERISG